jgi:predicted nuclease of predicted toxin-antitoxin system
MVTSAWAFLLDENMPKRVAHILRAAGYPAARVIEVGLRAQPDSLIFAYARSRRLIIITRDADYLDAARFRPPHAGILVMKFPSGTSVSDLSSRLMAALDSLLGEDLADRTYLLDTSALVRTA